MPSLSESPPLQQLPGSIPFLKDFLTPVNSVPRSGGQSLDVARTSACATRLLTECLTKPWRTASDCRIAARSFWQALFPGDLGFRDQRVRDLLPLGPRTKPVAFDPAVNQPD